jgi:DNA-directed RNA polymerase subunit L
MELKIIEESKTRMIFEVKGEDHTFCNALKQQLTDSEDVKLASYKIDHPLIGSPVFILETKSKEPKKVIADAAKELQKELDKFKKLF